MKILCVCEHGNTRSVALAYLIKTIYKHEALACGMKNMSDETRQMLFAWADKIIFLTDNPPGGLETFENKKALYLGVGKDVWFNPKDQELIHRLLKKIKDLNL